MPNEVKLLPCGVENFLSAILAKTPNGEWITVQYHPDGDWSVAAEAVSMSEDLAWLKREVEHCRRMEYAAEAQRFERIHDALLTRPTTVVTDEVVERVIPREATEAMVEAAAATPGMKAVNDLMMLHQARGYGFKAGAFDEGSPLHQAWRAMYDTARASMPTVVTGEQPQDVGDHALPCSASSPVSRSRPKAAAAIARRK